MTLRTPPQPAVRRTIVLPAGQASADHLPNFDSRRHFADRSKEIFATPRVSIKPNTKNLGMDQRTSLVRGKLYLHAGAAKQDGKRF